VINEIPHHHSHLPVGIVQLTCGAPRDQRAREIGRERRHEERNLAAVAETDEMCRLHPSFAQQSDERGGVIFIVAGGVCARLWQRAPRARQICRDHTITGGQGVPQCREMLGTLRETRQQQRWIALAIFLVVDARATVFEPCHNEPPLAAPCQCALPVGLASHARRLTLTPYTVYSWLIGDQFIY